MKFRFLVSGPAVSDAQIEALRHSIEDLAQGYGLDRFATPFMVELLKAGRTIVAVDDLPDSFGAPVVIDEPDEPLKRSWWVTPIWPFRTYGPLHLIAILVNAGFFMTLGWLLRAYR